MRWRTAITVLTAVSLFTATAQPSAMTPTSAPGAASDEAAIVGARSALPGSAADPLPTRAAVVGDAQRALNFYYDNNGGATAKNDWYWSTFFNGMEALYSVTGNAADLTRLNDWGRRHRWTNAPSPAGNPDTRLAIGDFYDINTHNAVDLGPSDATMRSDLGLPADAYWWIDGFFMALPNWVKWTERTGDPAYAAKGAALYHYAKTDGWTSQRPSDRCAQHPGTGLFDPAESLWYRDCTFVDARDSQGHKVFWSRGNGWMIAGLTKSVMALPATDPMYDEYRGMIQQMAARLITLQGADGMWPSNLLSPEPDTGGETSGTAAFVFALAHGVRAGYLDEGVYGPVIARAWKGLATIALRSDGFLSRCQGRAEGPGPYSTTESSTYCVGLFALAAAEVSQLTGNAAAGRPVTASSQVVGREATKAVDGSIDTYWRSTGGFPRSLTVDLGATRTVTETQVAPYANRPYRYAITTSVDNITWRTVVDRTANTDPGPFRDITADLTGDPVEARYVRLTVTGIADGSTTEVAIRDFGVYGPYVTRDNLAPGTALSATSSSSGHPVSNLTDNSWSSSWLSSSVRTTDVLLDLGARRPIDTIRFVTGDDNRARDVQVFGSTAGPATGYQRLTATRLADTALPQDLPFPTTRVRWLKVRFTSSWGTAGIRVAEVGVYGP